MSDQPVITPPEPGRIARVSAATPANSPATAPGAGGWVPAPWAPLVAALAIGVLGSVGPVLLMPGLTAAAVLAAVFSGVASGLGAYFGIKSAGPRIGG